MTRSSRLLTVGILVILLGIVVLLFATMGRGTEPIVVNEGTAADTGAAGTEGTAPVDDTTVVGTLGEDELRLPVPLVIPDGMEAVAVAVPYDRAVASLPSPGDHVNVYGVFQHAPDDLFSAAELAAIEQEEEDGLIAEGNPSGVVRVLSGVEVLGLSGSLPETGGGTVNVVLAIAPDDVERAVYLAAFQEVWLSLVTADHEPVDGVGVTRDRILDEALG